MKDASSGIGLERSGEEPLIELTARPLALARGYVRRREARVFWAGTVAVAAGLAAVLGWFLRAWPPHEDEALALFVGRTSFGDLLRTVIAERGGAPLHFAFAWLCVHLGGGLTALRLFSLVFAVASVPLIAALGARLADRTAGLTAALLASGAWVLIFHGIYARMYSLFLFTSLLSFLALLRALDEPEGTSHSTRWFSLWGLSLLAVLASHPYAVLVIGAQALFLVLRRDHLRQGSLTLAGVGLLGLPFLWADVVLRDRFDVGIGGGGAQLGSPGSVLRYLWWVSGDFSAGRGAPSMLVLLLALAGAVLLARRRPRALVLTGCVLGVPAIAFMAATLRSTTSPEARHLIFALPFFSLLLAVPLAEFARRHPPLTTALALAAVAVLLAGEVRWAHRKTPALFDGQPHVVVRSRDAAAAWLAATARPDDVLLGYEPVFLRAWELNRSFSDHAVPRADPALLADALRDMPEPLGRGVWVFDASDTTNPRQQETIPFVLPAPASAFEGRVYGPYLVIRSRRPLVTRARYVTVSARVMRLGRSLQIGDADINLRALLQARSRL